MPRHSQGFVLIVVTSFLTVMLFLAGTIYMVLTTNVKQTGYSASGATAFGHADAGADYVLSRLRADLQSGTLQLNAPVINVNYTAPTGFVFDPVTSLQRLSNRRSYRYRVVGHAQQASAAIDVVVGDGTTLMPGVFGNEGVSLQPNNRILSYRSGTTLTPTTSTGEAMAASNVSMGGQNDAVDGIIYLGESSSGTPATYPNEFSTSATVVRTDRLDPDPLGVSGGYLATRFAAVAATNDNATASGGTISGGQLRITGDVTLSSGRYYVSAIDLANHRTLTINASSGPVYIFLTGPVSTDSQSSIVVNPAVPANFQIYANGTSAIRFQPNYTFVGFIYAPFASVTVQPGANFYGAVWGRTLSLQPGGQVYVDMDFLDGFTTGRPPQVLSWRQVFD